MDTQSTLKLLGELADRRNVAAHVFIDRALTVSTSALAFSLTFRSSLAGPQPQQVWLLETAWICLGVTSLCGVFMHLAAVSASQRAIRRLRDNNDELTPGSSPHPVFELLYFLLCLSFPLGFVAMVAFGIINTN